MKLFVFEGTTEEFIVVAPSLGLKQETGVEDLNAVSEIPPEASEGAIIYLTVDQVKAVLTRRPLDWAMKLMFRRLYEAGDQRVGSNAIREELGFSAPQFRGMMGAFGRRKANTGGIPPDARLFDEKWDFDQHQKTWSLPPSTRKAIEDLKLDEDDGE